MISCFLSSLCILIEWPWWSNVHATCQESNLSWWPSLSRWVAEGWRHSWKTMRAITTGLKFTLSAPRLKSGFHWHWHLHEDQYSPVGAIHPVLFNCREAWLRLSMQYHPDLNPDDEKAANRFLEIKESYTGLIRTLIWQFQCLIWSNISQSWSMMRKGKLTMTR